MVISEDKMKNKKLTEANLVPYKKEQTEAVIKKIQKGVYGESLKEDFTKEAKEVLDKLEAEGWTTLSNLVRDGDRYFYILRKLQRDENGNPVKVIWKAVDEKTGEELDISYN